MEKIAWIYLTDNCDHAGIWPAAFDLMSSDIGFEIDATSLLAFFGDKVIQLSNDKFFLPGYIEFQYGELSEESKPHLSVIKILQKYGIDHKKLTLLEGYPKSIDTLKDKDKEKAKDNSLGKSAEKTLSLAAKELYKRYPRKLGKADGIKRLVARFKAGLTTEQAEGALDRFLAHHKTAGTGADFLPYFSTWIGDLDDWLDPETGQAEDFSEKPKSIADLELPDYSQQEGA